MATTTIEVDRELIRRAEEIATARGMSVSAYLDRLLRVVTQPPPMENELGPITRSLLGVLSPMTDAEVDQALEEARMEKYGHGPKEPIPTRPEDR